MKFGPRDAAEPKFARAQSGFDARGAQQEGGKVRGIARLVGVIAALLARARPRSLDRGDRRGVTLLPALVLLALLRLRTGLMTLRVAATLMTARALAVAPRAGAMMMPRGRPLVTGIGARRR